MKTALFIDDVHRYVDALRADLDLENVFWVHDGDEAEDWCYSCCKAKVRHLRRHGHDRKHRKEFCVDGGWGSESDSVATCEGCGKLLAYSLTNFGMESELDHFLTYEIFLDDGSLDPHTAYELSRIFSAAAYAEGDVAEDVNRLADEIRRHILPGPAWRVAS